MIIYDGNDLSPDTDEDKLTYGCFDIIQDEIIYDLYSGTDDACQ